MTATISIIVLSALLLVAVFFLGSVAYISGLCFMKGGNE